MQPRRTLIDLFEIVPSGFPASSVRAQFRSKERTLLDPYELRAAEPRAVPYRSKQLTLVDPFEARKKSA
jgi:hypothetical protein